MYLNTNVHAAQISRLPNTYILGILYYIVHLPYILCLCILLYVETYLTYVLFHMIMNYISKFFAISAGIPVTKSKCWNAKMQQTSFNYLELGENVL